MAGSKTFLQPILNETVGGIQSAVDTVKSSVDLIPGKIDAQITAIDGQLEALGNVVEELQNTQQLIGSTAAGLNVTANGEELEKIDFSISGSGAGTNAKAFTIAANCSGSVLLKFEVKSYSSSYPSSIHLGINGTKVKSIGSVSSTSYVEFSVIAKISKGDEISLIYDSTSISLAGSLYWRNVSISYALFNPTVDSPFTVL